MGFQDKYLMYHDKNDRISGNGVLYSAYALQNGMYSPQEIMKIKQHMRRLVTIDISFKSMYTQRYFELDQPDSLDNLVGFLRWDLIDYKDLEMTGWYFAGSQKLYSRYSWSEFIKVAWNNRKELLADRNYFRENNLNVIGKLAYWVPWQYRYYAKARKQQETTLLEKAAFYSHVLFMSLQSSKKKKSSPKNIVVLMLEDLGSKYLIKLFNKKKQYKEYFGTEHPLYQEV